MQRRRIIFAFSAVLGMGLATLGITGCGGGGDTGQAIELPAGTQPLTPTAAPTTGPGADANTSQGEPNTP